MTAEEQPDVLGEVRTALEHEPRVNLHRYPIVIDRDDAGALILEGETESIAAKKVALEVAASTPGVTGIVDRLRVTPARRMGDGEIRDQVRDALLAEPAFANCTIRTRANGRWDTVREIFASDGNFCAVSVEDGIVTLEGTVKSLSHKALGGALAWWVPGSRESSTRSKSIRHNRLTTAKPEQRRPGAAKGSAGRRGGDSRACPKFRCGPGRVRRQSKRKRLGRDGTRGMSAVRAW